MSSFDNKAAQIDLVYQKDFEGAALVAKQGGIKIKTEIDTRGGHGLAVRTTEATIRWVVVSNGVEASSNPLSAMQPLYFDVCRRLLLLTTLMSADIVSYSLLTIGVSPTFKGSHQHLSERGNGIIAAAKI